MENPTPKKRFSAKGFTSLLLTCSFLVLAVSGIILFMTPKGRDAHWTNWTMLGLGKEGWGAVHINNSILFLAASEIKRLWIGCGLNAQHRTVNDA